MLGPPYPKDTSVKTAVGAGILLSSLAYLFFAMHDAMIKLLVESTTVWQILFCRSIAILLGCYILGGRSLARETVTSPALRPMMLRSVVCASCEMATR